jgi:hypothetical protein
VGVLRVIAGVLGAGLVLLMLAEFFVTFLLPRRVKRDPRIARQLYSTLWRPWRSLAGRLSRTTADTLLGLFGPLGLLMLLGLWTLGLIAGFAGIHWANDTHFGGGHHGLGDDLYFSGGAFFSASTGLSPRGGAAHVLNIAEAGTGFAVLFIVIGYLPSLYQAFSRREVAVSRLDPRAGSPPTAATFLLHSAREGGWEPLDAHLREWEPWAAELMETHLSYPLLGFFRSQHVNQSWLTALTTVMDTCAISLTQAPARTHGGAELTFALGRHALADLTYTFHALPRAPLEDRLPDEDLARLRSLLADAGMELADDEASRQRLRDRRAMYEPYANAISEALALPLPSWLPEDEATPNWKLGATHSGAAPGLSSGGGRQARRR